MNTAFTQHFQYQLQTFLLALSDTGIEVFCSYQLTQREVAPGTLQAKKQYVNTKKATKSLQLFCRLTQNVSVSPWALSSWQKIRSTTGLH
jgi:hypothetical protein